MSSLPIVSRRALRKSQATLFDRLASCVKNRQAITLAEARSIWVSTACRNVINGKPHMYRSYYDHAKQTWRQELEPLSDEEIDFATMNWLTRTTGILVMKGYLRIVPQIELGD